MTKEAKRPFIPRPQRFLDKPPKSTIIAVVSLPQTNLTRWTHLWQDLSAAGPAEPVYADIMKRWSEPHRHYHNLQHLNECFAFLDEYKSQAQQPAVLEIALWFHDVIYDPKAHGTNERQSAELARFALRNACVSENIIEQVYQLIMVTQHHQPNDTLDAALMSDIDLAILGQPNERFQTYEQAIRAEYAWVQEADYIKGRSEFLKIFLQRPRIYTTSTFYTRFEDIARQNLHTSVEQLS